VDVVTERLTTTSFPVVTFNLAGPVDSRRLRDLGELVLRPAISRVPGVGRVEVLGGDVREMEVIVDPARAAALRLTPSRVAEKVRDAAVLQAVGRFDDAHALVAVIASGEATNAADVAVLPVAVGADGSPVPLSAIANVVEGAEDRLLRVSGPGGETVLVSVSRLPGASTPDVVARIRAAADGAVLPARRQGVHRLRSGGAGRRIVGSVRDAILIGTRWRGRHRCSCATRGGSSRPWPSRDAGDHVHPVSLLGQPEPHVDGRSGRGHRPGGRRRHRGRRGRAPPPRHGGAPEAARASTRARCPPWWARRRPPRSSSCRWRGSRASWAASSSRSPPRFDGGPVVAGDRPDCRPLRPRRSCARVPPAPSAPRFARTYERPTRRRCAAWTARLDGAAAGRGRRERSPWARGFLPEMDEGALSWTTPARRDVAERHGRCRPQDRTRAPSLPFACGTSTPVAASRSMLLRLGGEQWNSRLSNSIACPARIGTVVREVARSRSSTPG
jgi:hypothetical protein